MRKIAPSLLVLAMTMSLGGCFGSKRDVSENVARARQYVEQGRTDKAEVELKDALKLNPADPQANLALAKIEDSQGDIQAAIPHYMRAASPDLRLIEPQLRIVELLIDANRFTDAAGRINTSLGSFPNSAQALALRADLNERQGLVAQAQTDADSALQKDPNNARALAVAALLKLRAKDGQAGLEIVNRGLKQHPQDLRLLQVQAATLMTMNEPEKAVETLKTIVRTAPRNVAIQTTLAEIEAGNGHQDDAIAGFKAAIDADPADEAMQLAFVGFLARQQKSDDVVTYLKSLVARNPKSETYDLILAEYLRGRNQLPQAQAVLNQAAARLGQGKAFANVKVALAKIDVSEGRVDRAWASLGAILAADPDDEEALLLRAILAMQGQRAPQAVEDALKVVRTNPANARAFEVMANAYLSMGEPKLAVNAMQRAVAVAPGEQSPQVKLAAFMQQAGQNQAAQELMSRLTLQDPNDAKIWAANARLAIERKDWSAAALSVSRLRELPSGVVKAAELDGEILAAKGDAAGAVRSLQKAIVADPGISPAALKAYAEASVSLGKAGEAAAFIAQHVPAAPAEARQTAELLVMTLWADAGAFDKSFAAFQTATKESPRWADLYTTCVKILLSQNRIDQARDVAKTGLAAGATRTDLLLARGAVEEKAGDLKAALDIYREAADGDPMSLVAANNYASILSDQSPGDKAALEEAKGRLAGADQTKIPTVLDTLAWVDYRLGQFDEAKKLLVAINAAQSPKPQIRFHMAAILLATGDKQQGNALLATVKGLTFVGSDEVRKLSET